MEHRLTVSAFVENTPGILHRVTTLFTRRKVNIESLTVSETHKKGISRVTLVVTAPKELVLKIATQVERIIEARDVLVSENRELVFKEIALFKVKTSSPKTRGEVEALANRYDASVEYGGEDFLVFEKTGREDEIDALYLLLEPYGISDFIRSGRVALLKHPESVQ